MGGTEEGRLLSRLLCLCQGCRMRIGELRPEVAGCSAAAEETSMEYWGGYSDGPAGQAGASAQHTGATGLCRTDTAAC